MVSVDISRNWLWSDPYFENRIEEGNLMFS